MSTLGAIARLPGHGVDLVKFPARSGHPWATPRPGPVIEGDRVVKRNIYWSPVSVGVFEGLDPTFHNLPMSAQNVA
jgi:hypothetical protein